MNKPMRLRIAARGTNPQALEVLTAIMQAYRWRDPNTVMRYGVKFAAKGEAGARFAEH
jgi:hypothetical protein